MNSLFVAICSFVILLGFEIRHRVAAEEVAALKAEARRLDDEIVKLKAEMKMKKNIYEEYKPSSGM